MNLFFQEFGSGPSLIIVHGLFGMSDNWVSLGKKFAKDFRVIIPDLRNHGRSPHSPLFDFPSMEEDILELIEEETKGEVLLLGHSLGGRIAVNLALHHPQLIKKLVIVDIGLRKYPPFEEQLHLLNVMQQLDLEGIKRRSDAERKLEHLTPSLRLRQFLLKNLYWLKRDKLAWRINLQVISENIPSLFEANEVPGVFRGPTLFIKGERSDYIGEEDRELINKKFPGSRIETIEGASHWVHADRPGEFYQVVSDFLKG